jgi:superoxide dismutase, Cu-Zn family
MTHRSVALGSALLASLALAGCAGSGGSSKSATATPKAARATATIESRSDSTAHGSAVFTAKGSQVTLKVTVEGAPAGTHALHVHEKGDCSAQDGSSAGGHFNPTSEAHGQWGHPPHHLGDIGNIEVGADGKGTLTLTTDKWSIGTGLANDVVGRSVILHAGVDDFKTQPTGNAGGRIGCGVIKAD